MIALHRAIYTIWNWSLSFGHDFKVLVHKICSIHTDIIYDTNYHKDPTFSNSYRIFQKFHTIQSIEAKLDKISWGKKNLINFNNLISYDKSLAETSFFWNWKKINFVDSSSSSEDVLVLFSWSVTGKKWPAHISHSETVGGKTFQRFAKSWGGYYCSTKGRLSCGESWVEKISLPRFGKSGIKSGGSGLKPPLGWRTNFLMCILSFAFNCQLTFFYNIWKVGFIWCCWFYSEAKQPRLHCFASTCSMLQLVSERCIPPLYSDLKTYMYTFSFQISLKRISRKKYKCFHCIEQGLEIIYSHPFLNFFLLLYTLGY